VKFIHLLIFVATTIGWLRAADPTRTPVLLELFTSEGCSSCPPADRLLELLDRTQPIAGADVIVLSEHVDYWNSLGWRDPFSSAALTQRQDQYASKLHLESVYTPQLIVDGRSELVGSNAVKVKQVVEMVAREEKAPLQIEALESQDRKSRVRISLRRWPNGVSGRATLFLAIASNQTQSRVSAGENSGKQLTHVSVVRSLQSLGDIEVGVPLSRDIAIPLNPAERSSVRVVAFIQDTRSLRVLGVAQLRPIQPGQSTAKGPTTRLVLCHARRVARGWESKSVESQIESALERQERRFPQPTPEQVQRQRELEGLESSRTRVLKDLANTTHERYRAQLQAALSHLDEKIASLG